MKDSKKAKGRDSKFTPQFEELNNEFRSKLKELNSAFDEFKNRK